MVLGLSCGGVLERIGVIELCLVIACAVTVCVVNEEIHLIGCAVEIVRPSVERLAGLCFELCALLFTLLRVIRIYRISAREASVHGSVVENGEEIIRRVGEGVGEGGIYQNEIACVNVGR